MKGTTILTIVSKTTMISFRKLIYVSNNSNRQVWPYCTKTTIFDEKISCMEESAFIVFHRTEYNACYSDMFQMNLMNIFDSVVWNLCKKIIVWNLPVSDNVNQAPEKQVLKNKFQRINPFWRKTSLMLNCFSEKSS